MFKKFLLKEGDSRVEKFQLKEFSLRPTVEASSFERSELISTKNFVINDSSSKKSGLSYLKDKRIANEIDKKVNVKLEEAKSKIYDELRQLGYDEGFESGVDEGKKSILEKFNSDVEKSLIMINNISEKLEQTNKNLIKNNQHDLTNLIKLACEKICLHQISIDDSVIKQLIEETLNENKNEENLKFLLAESDFTSLNNFKNEIKSSSLPMQVEFEVSSEVEPGGLILDLDSGRVNKTVEARFTKIWEALGL